MSPGANYIAKMERPLLAAASEPERTAPFTPSPHRDGCYVQVVISNDRRQCPPNTKNACPHPNASLLHVDRPGSHRVVDRCLRRCNFTTAGGVLGTVIAKWNGTSWSVLEPNEQHGVVDIAVSVIGNATQVEPSPPQVVFLATGYR